MVCRIEYNFFLICPEKAVHISREPLRMREKYKDPYLTKNNMVQLLTQPSLKKKVAHPYLNSSKKDFQLF